jgi:hypothetical protein
MNQRDLETKKATNQDLLGVRDCSKDCEDVVALRVCPPTALDWFTDDRLG